MRLKAAPKMLPWPGGTGRLHWAWILGDPLRLHRDTLVMVEHNPVCSLVPYEDLTGDSTATRKVTRSDEHVGPGNVKLRSRREARGSLQARSSYARGEPGSSSLRGPAHVAENTNH